jgi:O-antigen/teichoic acid export membrane protein
LIKNSYIYLTLQLFNIVVGLFVTLFIARNVGVEKFAIFAVYNIVLVIFSTFTFLGYENVLIRNVLHWQKVGQHKKIKNLISNAIFSRVITSLLLQVPMVIYLFYLSETRFNHEYFALLCTFNLAGVFAAISNANGLILKAFDRFLLSFFVTIISSLLGRIIAVFAFFKIGFDGFIFILIIVPFVTCIISTYFIKDFISFGSIRYKYFWKFKNNKYFIFSGYLNYFKVSLDQLLVSVFLSVETLAVYNLAKKVEDIGRTALSSFFDAILQKLVLYKNDQSKAIEYKNKIYRIKYIFLICIFSCTLFFNFYVGDLIRLLGLEHYENLESYIIIASWTAILYLNYKIESHIISLFESPIKLFTIDVIISAFSTVVVVSSLYFLPLEFLYLNRVFIGSALIAYYAFYYRKKFHGRF